MAGGDLRALASAGLDNEGWLQRFQDMNDWVRDLISLDRPVVAAVDGMATGAGLSLALTADFVLATPRARFSASFLRVGLVPDCGCLYTLPRAVGVQRRSRPVVPGTTAATRGLTFWAATRNVRSLPGAITYSLPSGVRVIW